MANKYEKSGQLMEFEAGDYCTIKVPKKDRPTGATSMRILARVLRRYGHLYMLQTKYGNLQSKYGAQDLNQIDQCTAEQDAAQLDNNRRKITLRHAQSITHRHEQKENLLRCSGECRTARCVCKKTGIGCTIYCHKRTGECPNKAEGSAYTQITVIEQEQVDDDKMQV